MKLLIVGMDGVTYSTFERGWTPFIASLISKGDRLNVEEDLLSRGWSEIVTGQHAINSGALYERPLMNGGYGWTESFKIADVPSLGEGIKPFWQVLNERGLKVGVMNVPTTFPAPKVDGFFVSGGGGGGPVTQTPTLEQCSDSDVHKYLLKQGYIVDERFGSLLGEKKLYSAVDFFERLVQKVRKRTEAFIHLAKERDIDCGFIVYKSATVGAESLVLPELLRKKNEDSSVNQEIVAGAEELYRNLDLQVKLLHESFPDAKIVLVSDHATVNKVADVNLNALLVECGFQKHSATKVGLYRIIKRNKHLIPYFIKKRMKQKASVKSAYESMVTFDAKRSLAFSMTLSNGLHGIYMNDRNRFGGPVPSSEVARLAMELVSKINAHPLFGTERFFAEAVEKKLASKQADQFPDVVIRMPDGYQTSTTSKEVIERYELPHQKVTLKDAEKDLRSTMKGHAALAVSIGHNWHCPGRSSGDLTMVYDHILNTML